MHDRQIAANRFGSSENDLGVIQSQRHTTTRLGSERSHWHRARGISAYAQLSWQTRDGNMTVHYSPDKAPLCAFRLSANQGSVRNPQPKLHAPGTNQQSSNLPEIGARQRKVGSPELRMIPGVEHFPPELNVRSLAYPIVLDHTQVPVIDPGLFDRIPCGVSLDVDALSA